MRYFIFSLFILISVSGISQGKIAFLNRERILDTMIYAPMAKFRSDVSEEMAMMKDIYRRKSETHKECKQEKSTGCTHSDTAEYFQRIKEREKQIQHDLFEKEAELREESEKKLNSEWDKFMKKKGYVEWKDISPGIPLEYRKADDYTEYMILILL